MEVERELLGGINREYSGYEINLEKRGKGWEGIGWELIVIMYQTELSQGSVREFNWEAKAKYWSLRLNLDRAMK